MIHTNLCDTCIHKPVCFYEEEYKEACYKVLDNVDIKLLIVDVKCFFYEERK